jgi:repressor of nif and glnA expression
MNNSFTLNQELVLLALKDGQLRTAREIKDIIEYSGYKINLSTVKSTLNRNQNTKNMSKKKGILFKITDEGLKKLEDLQNIRALIRFHARGSH